MKTLKHITAIFAMAAITLSSHALTRVSIVGDRSALGSADTTIVAGTTPAGAYTWASGLYLTPGEAPSGSHVPYKAAITNGYGQTVIDGIHSRMGANGEEIVYDILSFGNTADLAALGGEKPSDYVVWMQNSYVNTNLTELIAAMPAQAKVILVQPANGGNIFAARPASAEYARPAVTVEQAMVDVAAGNSRVAVVPSYVGDFGVDNVPIADGMMRIGRAIGDAAFGFAPSATASGHTVTVTAGDAKFAVGNLVADAQALGFEIWRGNDSDARHLNISKAVVNTDGTVTLTVDERLLAGDMVIYGTSDAGIGRMNGRRGNLLADNAACPVFALTVGNVAVEGANISGTITCEGVPVAGVPVSDGYDITQTDANGHYSLISDKRLGYVFYTLPSGYEPEVADNGWEIKHFALLDSDDKNVAETHDFRLTKVDNTNHIMIVGADAHIAARNSDKSQFKKTFVKSVKNFVAANPDAKIYSTILGDMSWDQYWYANNYALPDFKETLTSNGWPLKFFPVMGNHDNDGSVPASAQTDYLSAKAFRTHMAPTYYSYNLGNVHYVVLDDVVYKNTYTAGKTYAEGIVGDRDYGKYYTDEQLEWLRRDLEDVTDKSTPIVVCFHIQNWILSTNGTFTVSSGMENSAADNLARVLAPFSDVHLLSGHTHYNYHAHPAKYPNIHENNVGGICATWWWTGKLVDRHICKDGSPGGYAVYRADGKKLTWQYNSSEDDTYPQMRIYDMNAVKKTYKEDADFQAWIKYDATQTNYGTIADNTVYINVFNYDTDWTVEVWEGDEARTATRITAQDPMHIICYDVPRYKAAGTITGDFITNKTNHMFKVACTSADAPVRVRLRDSHGQVFEHTLTRPGEYSTSM